MHGECNCARTDDWREEERWKQLSSLPRANNKLIYSFCFPHSHRVCVCISFSISISFSFVCSRNRMMAQCSMRFNTTNFRAWKQQQSSHEKPPFRRWRYSENGKNKTLLNDRTKQLHDIEVLIIVSIVVSLSTHTRYSIDYVLWGDAMASIAIFTICPRDGDDDSAKPQSAQISHRFESGGDLAEQISNWF